MHSVLFEPYVRSFAFDSATRTSAAATLSSLHFYLVRHPEDIIASWLVDDPDSLIIKPIVAYIRSRGGRVICGNRVTDLVQDDTGRVVGVQTSERIPDSSCREPRRSGSLAHIRRNAISGKGSLAVEVEHKRTLVIEEHGNDLVAHEAAGRGDDDVTDVAPVSSGDTDGTLTTPRPLLVDHTDTGVVVQEPGRRLGATGELARVPRSSVPLRGFILDPMGGQVFVGRYGSEEEIVAISAICTHMGKTIAWDGKDRFGCPAHGAQFRPSGQVLRGPATRALPRYDVVLDGPDVVVRGDKGRPPILEAEHVILAVDVESCKRVIPDHFRDQDMFRQIDYLSTTPVVVVRLWFDGPRLFGDKTSGIFVDYPLLDNFFVLSNLQRSFRNSTETVIEVQAYLVDKVIDLPDGELLKRVLEDLGRAFGAVKELTPKETYILRHRDVFTHHSPGSDQYRPGTRTTVPHLHLAGDWVNRAPEVWHMERAVVSGCRAACSVIEDAGGVGPTVRAIREAGVLFRVCAAVARATTKICRWMRALAGGDERAWPEGGKVAREWSSTLLFGVYKFRGQPAEQFVTGKFRRVNAQVTVKRAERVLEINGTMRIDLNSVDTGRRMRDCAIRTVLFGAPAAAEAVFVLTEAKPRKGDVKEMLSGQPVIADCRGTLELNRVSRTITFPARVALVPGGLASVLSTDDIVVGGGRLWGGR